MDEYVLYLYLLFLNPQQLNIEYEQGTICITDFDMITILENNEWQQYDLHGD